MNSAVLALPTSHADPHGQSLRVPLKKLSCVADSHEFVSFIAKETRQGVTEHFAYAFKVCQYMALTSAQTHPAQSASIFTARYITEEIIAACNIVRARKAAAGPTTDDATEPARPPATPHTVTEGAMMMLQDAALLESILMSVPVDLARFRPQPKTKSQPCQ